MTAPSADRRRRDITAALAAFAAAIPPQPNRRSDPMPSPPPAQPLTVAPPVQWFVPGLPMTEGSTRAVIHKHTGRPHVIHDNQARLERWRDQVAWHARQAFGPGVRWPKPIPVTIAALFLLPVPQSASKAVRAAPPAHTVKPDLDKLTRAIGDALTGRAYADDPQVTRWLVAKRYAEPGEVTGVHLVALATPHPDPLDRGINAALAALKPEK